MNAYGATLAGIPALGITFNDHLAWTHTVNAHGGEDLYELTLIDGGYRWDGGVRPFETRQAKLKVKQPDGTLIDEELVVRSSVHGPVVAEKNGKALALRVVGLDRPRMLAQYWDMARATNLDEFETALKRLEIPMFTIIYADRDGHIMHFFGGITPVRPLELRAGRGSFPATAPRPFGRRLTATMTFPRSPTLPVVGSRTPTIHPGPQPSPGPWIPTTSRPTCPLRGSAKSFPPFEISRGALDR